MKSFTAVRILRQAQDERPSTGTLTHASPRLRRAEASESALSPEALAKGAVEGAVEETTIKNTTETIDSNIQGRTHDQILSFKHIIHTSV